VNYLNANSIRYRGETGDALPAAVRRMNRKKNHGISGSDDQPKVHCERWYDKA
jgi:hypothetical protein